MKTFDDLTQEEKDDVLKYYTKEFEPYMKQTYVLLAQLVINKDALGLTTFLMIMTSLIKHAANKITEPDNPDDNTWVSKTIGNC